MTLEELREKLKKAERRYKGDVEILHGKQDELLLDFINDDEVTDIFNRTVKWYA